LGTAGYCNAVDAKRKSGIGENVFFWIT